MSSDTLLEIVIDQVIAEGPDHYTLESEYEIYARSMIDYMPKSELLERISLALDKMRARKIL